MTDEERYTMQEAGEKLGIAPKTLINWINRAGLRQTVDSQIDEVDRRIHYLTRAQLEKLAKDHRVSMQRLTQLKEEISQFQAEKPRDIGMRIDPGVWSVRFSYKEGAGNRFNTTENYSVELRPTGNRLQFISVESRWSELTINLFVRGKVATGEWRLHEKAIEPGFAPDDPRFNSPYNLSRPAHIRYGTMQVKLDEHEPRMAGKWVAYDDVLDEIIEGECDFIFFDYEPTSTRLPFE